jgi:trehalose synthase
MQTADIDLLRVVAEWGNHYDAAIFSAAHFVTPDWPLPKFIIPPFIDPLSEKNRELTRKEIESVLTKYHIDTSIPMIVQIGRFDPWKGLDRTIATYRQLIKMRECRLVLAGGLANDDPEGIRILDQVLEMTRHDDNIHVINLSMENRLENYREVNALQRAASVIMQPSKREGFGLVITEALWKGKPVIAGNTGAIRLQVTNGHNAYFYENPKKTAETIDFLLSNPDLSAEIGQRGNNYVKEHFLMPDRIADYLMAVEMIIGSAADKTRWPESIISFHPWYKLDNNR